MRLPVFKDPAAAKAPQRDKPLPPSHVHVSPIFDHTADLRYDCSRHQTRNILFHLYRAVPRLAWA